MAPTSRSSITCLSAVAADGSVLRFVHNWSWNEAQLPLPAPVFDLLSGAALRSGEVLTLGPWNVRVLTSSADTANEA